MRVTPEERAALLAEPRQMQAAGTNLHSVDRTLLHNLLADLAESEERVTTLERDLKDHNEASADALNQLWKEVLLRRKPDYGDWEYPGQAFRHLRDEFAELEAREKVLVILLGHAVRTNHGYKPEVCSGCSGIKNALAECPTPSAGAKPGGDDASQ